jgi:hypothetical protein
MGSAKKKANDLGIRHVSAKEVRELSKLAWVPDETLSTDYSEARVLPDGRVLHVSLLVGPKTGGLSPSRAAAEEMKRRLTETKRQMIEQAAGRTPHAAVTLLPPIDDFLRDVEAHARSLGPRLRIPDEALDGSVASLGAVDKALKRIPLAERPVADLVTPLVAYVGEVLRRASGGRWIKLPPTYTGRQPVFDPAELAAWQEALAVGQRAFTAVQQRGRGGSSPEAFEASRQAIEATGVREPKPIRFDMVETPSGGCMNEPMIRASNGKSFQPFGDVFIPMIEPSKRPPLLGTVELHLQLAGYPQAPKPAA